MTGAWARWVRLWSGREPPWSLAAVRILLGAVILYDLTEIARLGLIDALFAGQPLGLSDAAARTDPPLFTSWFGASPRAGHALYAAMAVSTAFLTAGLFTRASAVVLLFAWAQFAQILPAADRGIDTLCRDVLVVFVFADAGAAWSMDAWAKTGSWRGSGAPIPAWPRRLLVLQLVAMYFLAGVQKVGVHWWPPGHFAALYFILQDPAIARIDFGWLRDPPWFQLTQLGSAGTLLFQDTYPMVLLLRYAKSTASRGGWRARLAAWGWTEWVWIGTGAVFHLMLAATCELGIFPAAMLALYPAWLGPAEWAWLGQREGNTPAT
ncbi:MAG: HTTM domain-containing protein [Myxococcota bacterium]